MKQSKYPKGWNQVRVQQVIAHYEAQSEAEVIAEDEAAFDPAHATVMEVPPDLVPAVRQLIAKHRIARGDT
jgi:hypothetical protein